MHVANIKMFVHYKMITNIQTIWEKHINEINETALSGHLKKQTHKKRSYIVCNGTCKW